MVSVLSIGVMGYRNTLVNKSLEIAKTFIENKEYDKDLISLEINFDEIIYTRDMVHLKTWVDKNRNFVYEPRQIELLLDLLIRYLKNILLIMMTKR